MEEQDKGYTNVTIARNYLGHIETLEEHLTECFNQVTTEWVGKIKRSINYNPYDIKFKEWLKDEILTQIILYHDYGKVDEDVQQKIRLDERNNALTHANHSAFAYINDRARLVYEDTDTTSNDLGIKQLKLLWIYYLGYVISKHHGHGSVDGLYKFNASMQTYMDKEMYKYIKYYDGHYVAECIQHFMGYSEGQDITLREYETIQLSLDFLKDVDQKASGQFRETVIQHYLTEDDWESIQDYHRLLNDMTKDLHIVMDKDKSLKNYVDGLVLKNKEINDRDKEIGSYVMEETDRGSSVYHT